MRFGNFEINFPKLHPIKSFPLLFLFVFIFFIASKTHTEKKQKLHGINKVITRKKIKQIANLHTYMAEYLQIIKGVTAVLIPYITVLSMIYN